MVRGDARGPGWEDRLDVPLFEDSPAHRASLRRVAALATAIAVFLGIGDVVDWIAHPERRRAIELTYAIALLACGGAVAAVRGRLRRHGDAVGTALVVLLLVHVGWYNALAHNQADRLAMAQVVILCGSSVLLATPWRLQLAVAAAAMLVFGAVAPGLPTVDGLFFPALGVAIGATTTVFGAALLERHRRGAEEEARVNAALVRIGETLDEHLGHPDMLERVCRAAVALIGCDRAHVFLREEDRSALRLRASSGLAAEVRTELAQLEFRFEDIPLLRALRPGVTMTVSSATPQSAVSPVLLARFGVGSLLCAPISRGAEIRGLFVAGDRSPGHPWTPLDERIAMGIAHLTSLALENARLIEQLQTASRLKSEFVATMSHELRTPLNVITGYTDLLVEGALGELEPPQLAALHKLRRNARQLGGLIEETLDLGRLEAGREAIDLVPIDAGELFAELAAEVDGLAAPDVALRWRAELGREGFVCDRVKLKTILKNLVGNALKFTAAGVVEVSAWREGEVAVFRVRDTGIGIAEADVPVIFEMFRQLDSSPARAFEGVGLGLHIVARLTALLGGEVHVESQPGRGSTFTVELPLLDEDELGEAAHAGDAPPG